MFTLPKLQQFPGKLIEMKLLLFEKPVLKIQVLFTPQVRATSIFMGVKNNYCLWVFQAHMKNKYSCFSVQTRFKFKS